MVRPSFARLACALAIAAVAIEACAGDDAEAPSSTASGDDAGPGDRAPFDAGQPEPACDPDADLLEHVSDAAIADGASTTGICLGCARARCSEAIAACTMDCACQRIVGDAIGCYVTTQRITCAGELANVFVKPITRQYALTLVGCVKSECSTECVIEAGAPEPAPDASDDGG